MTFNESSSLPGTGEQRPVSVLTWLLMATLTAVGAALLYLAGLFVMVLWYNKVNPGSSAIMQQTLATLRQTSPEARLEHSWVDYENITINLKRAVIASEDARFFDHTGVEWEAIRKAWEYNRQQAQQGRNRMRGGSTITQQLAKNLFLSNERSYIRKGQELIITYMIELVMSKQRILELYLNLAQWGNDIFGAEAAAENYFKTTADRLTTSQAARLAAMLPNPAYYQQKGTTVFLASRTRTIQQRMRLVSIPE